MFTDIIKPVIYFYTIVGSLIVTSIAVVAYLIGRLSG